MIENIRCRGCYSCVPSDHEPEDLPRLGRRHHLPGDRAVFGVKRLQQRVAGGEVLDAAAHAADVHDRHAADANAELDRQRHLGRLAELRVVQIALHGVRGRVCVRAGPEITQSTMGVHQKRKMLRGFHNVFVMHCKHIAADTRPENVVRVLRR
jgi:hypothetical protein